MYPHSLPQELLGVDNELATIDVDRCGANDTTNAQGTTSCGHIHTQDCNMSTLEHTDLSHTNP